MLNQKLKEKRISMGLLQKDIAEMYNVSRSYVAKCENYPVTKNNKLVQKLIKKFKIE